MGREVMDSWKAKRDPGQKSPFSNDTNDQAVDVRELNDRDAEDLYKQCLSSRTGIIGGGQRDPGAKFLKRILESLKPFKKALELPEMKLVVPEKDSDDVKDYEY